MRHQKGWWLPYKPTELAKEALSGAQVWHVSGAGRFIRLWFLVDAGIFLSTLKPRYSTDSAKKEQVSFFKREVYILKLG